MGIFRAPRVFLLLGYWVILFIVGYVFVGYGDGSAAPFLILSSWSGLIVKLLSQALRLGEGGFVFQGSLVFLTLFALYYSGLIWLISRLSAVKAWFLFFLPMTIHIGGGIAFMLITERDHLWPSEYLGYQAKAESTRFFLASYIIPWVITLAWLLIDWRLAKRRLKGPRTVTPEAR